MGIGNKQKKGNLAPAVWLIDVHKGNDGIARSCMVKLIKGSLSNRSSNSDSSRRNTRQQPKKNIFFCNR